jgi:large subunit ribosomal protein L10e
MGLRPGHCYSDRVKKRAYTRVAKKVHKKNFVGGIPGLKIRQFHMGFGDRDYTHVLHLVTTDTVQIRDNALESSRITIVRQLNKKLTAQNFYMKLRVYPQFFLRENKQAQGAHADRIQQGMGQCPFGRVIGSSSRVRPNQQIISVLCDEHNIPLVKKVLTKANSRFPCRMKVVIEENKDKLKSVGTTKKRKKLLKAAASEEKEQEKIKETTKAAVNDAKKNVKEGKTNTKKKK